MPMTKSISNETWAIGLMSGTSLDGLDICLAKFELCDKSWIFSINKTTTICYTPELKNELANAMLADGQKLAHLNSRYGIWIAEQINEFLRDINVNVDIIGSHGHTVFHNPSLGFTTQIGSGAHIASITGIPCVCDFRMGDVARGGQGAPLVPIGDELLFNEYSICLNIGGIANISYQKDNRRVAYDVCPANMALNHFVKDLGFDFDQGGKIGQSGTVNKQLLEKINTLDYYSQSGPKSLGREWFEVKFLPLTKNVTIPINDLLRTLYEHMAIKISDAINVFSNVNVLITGGGAKNDFLVQLLRTKTNNIIVIPEPELIDFKEALIFGFLAVLYENQLPSSLSSVTGAKKDSIAGCLYY